MEYANANVFCSDDTFIRVWFAFTQIQELDSGIMCSTCGIALDIVIANGISLGTHVSKLTPSVYPPTHVNEHSEQILTISSYGAHCLPAITSHQHRTTVNKILAAMATLHPMADSDAGTFPNTSKLMDELPILFSFINLYLTNGVDSPFHCTHHDLIQQIATPNIMLQLVLFSAIAVLEDFHQSGSAPSWLQSLCPAFGAVLNTHTYTQTPVPLEL